MLNSYWYDKIASAAADAEAAVIDAAAQEAAAEDQGLIEKIEEDIQIAQEVAATDLPTDVKVDILTEQGVDENIIDEVIDADATDAVAAYYGVDPYWLHDKRASADKLAVDAQTAAQMAVLKSGLMNVPNPDAPVNIVGLNAPKGFVNPREAGAAMAEAMDDASRLAYVKAGKSTKRVVDALQADKARIAENARGRINATAAEYQDAANAIRDRYLKRVNALSSQNRDLLSDLNKTYAQRDLANRMAAENWDMYNKTNTALKGMTKNRNLWRGGAIGVGVLGAGAAGYLGYKLYKQQQAQAAAEAENARQAGIMAGLSADNSNMMNAGYGALGGAGLGALAGAGIGYALDGGQGALTGGLAGGLGGAALGGLSGYNYNRGRAAMGI